MRPPSLERRYLLNDLVRNTGVHVALLLILTMSAFLMSTGAVVMERLVGSVDALLEQAQPPHFLQMHTGNHDSAALTDFAAQHPEIESGLIEDMLGFSGAALSWKRPFTGVAGDLSESLIDNLFVTQNRDFDFLIDEQGTIPEPGVGEVYVPVVHQQGQALQRGDELRVLTDGGPHSLTIAGFVRDAQMASSLSSATRFLVSEQDFAHLRTAGGGVPEIIVEYRLADPALAGEFMTTYESEDALPKNGQAVTYRMIRLINSFSDGLVAVALMFISGLLMAISLLSLRFVIRGTLEEEVHEIGVMKAIGMPHGSIAGLYLMRYRAMALAACVIGGLLSIPAALLLTRTIEQNYAEAPTRPVTFIVPVMALALVYAVTLLMCRGILRALRRVEVVGALIHGSVVTQRRRAARARRNTRRARRTSLTRSSLPVSIRLAWLDLRADAGQWVLIPLVFSLAALVMALPTNVLTTFQSPRFVTHMGAPESDVRVDIKFTDDATVVHQRIMERMRGDDRIVAMSDFGDSLIQVQGGDGWETLRVQVGDQSGETIEFLQGRAPVRGEIAPSVLNAEHYGLLVGDAMTLRSPASGTAGSVTLSGIYQDVTSGGRTAKMHGDVPADAVSFGILVHLAEGADPAVIAAEYAEQHPGATVLAMRDYLDETLGSITSAFRSAALLAVGLGVAISLAITVLFLQLRLTRERSRMGVLSALGFTTRELAGQVLLKTFLTVTVGTVAGTLIAATVGESLVGSLMSLSGLGITRLTFIPNPWIVYVAHPLLLIATGCAGALALTTRLHRADRSGWLRS